MAGWVRPTDLKLHVAGHDFFCFPSFVQKYKHTKEEKSQLHKSSSMFHENITKLCELSIVLE